MSVTSALAIKGKVTVSVRDARTQKESPGGVAASCLNVSLPGELVTVDFVLSSLVTFRSDISILPIQEANETQSCELVCLHIGQNMAKTRRLSW